MRGSNRTPGICGFVAGGTLGVGWYWGLGGGGVRVKVGEVKVCDLMGFEWMLQFIR